MRIFIGSENKLFSLSGSSMIAAPFRDAAQKIVGVLGVIGPTRLNYARIVPMVDYTAKVVSAGSWRASASDAAPPAQSRISSMPASISATAAQRQRPKRSPSTKKAMNSANSMLVSRIAPTSATGACCSDQMKSW